MSASQVLKQMSRLTRHRSSKQVFETVTQRSNTEFSQSAKAEIANQALNDPKLMRIFFYLNLASEEGLRELKRVGGEDSEVETYLLLEASFPSSSIEINMKDVTVWMRERKNLILVEFTPVFDLEGDFEKQNEQSNAIMNMLSLREVSKYFAFSPDLFVSKREVAMERKVAFETMVVSLAVKAFKQELNVACLFLAVPSLTQRVRTWGVLEQYVERDGNTVRGVVKVIGGTVTDLRWLERLFLLFKEESQLRLPKGHNLAIVLDSVQRINFVVREQRQKSPVISFKNDIFQVETKFDRIQGLIESIDGRLNNINQLTFYKQEHKKDVLFTKSEEDTLLQLLLHHLPQLLSNVFHVYIKNTNFAASVNGRRILGILNHRETKRLNFYIKNNRKGPYNRAKMMVVGAGAAGKTSLCRSLLGKEFVSEHVSTLVGDCQLDAVFDDKDVDVSQWKDLKTSGQDVLSADYFAMGEQIRKDPEQGSFFVNWKAEVKKFNTTRNQTATALGRKKRTATSLTLRTLRKNGSSMSLKKFKTFRTGSFSAAPSAINIDENMNGNKRLSIWDFGGQRVFDVLHHLYLTNAGLVLLVVNLLLYLEQPKLAKDELRIWLKSLCIYTKSVKVIIVGTRAGEKRMKANGMLSLVDEMIQDVLYDFDTLSIVVNHNASLVFFPVENAEETGTGAMLDPLKAAIGNALEPSEETEDFKLPCNMKIPLAWMFFAKLIHNSGANITSSMELVTKGVDMGFTESEMKDLIGFFSRAGIFVTFHERFQHSNRDEGTLVDDVVLRPEWLLSAFGTFIFDKTYHASKILTKIFGEVNIRKFVQLYKKNGIMTGKLFTRILELQGITKRESQFLLHLSENMLIMSKLGSVPEKYKLKDRHLAEAKGFWLVPAMNRNTERRLRTSKVKVTGYITWEGLVPEGLFERCVCSFLAQDTGLVSVKSITSSFASLKFKGVFVHLECKKPTKYEVTVFSGNPVELREVKTALLKMNTEINTLGFAMPVKATVKFGQEIVRPPAPMPTLKEMRESEVKQSDLRWDTFLSHTWGPDKATHAKVVEIGELLKQEGVKVWIDADQVKEDIAIHMVEGMNSSASFIAFITKEYLAAADDKNSNAGRELHYYANKVGSEKIIPVLLDPTIPNPNEWKCCAGLYLGQSLYIDFTTDENIKQNLPQLCERITSVTSVRKKPKK